MASLAKAHERRFGVEIECGHTNGYGYVAEQMAGAGFQLGSYRDGRYNVGSDGSGVEVRTPILQGKEGFKELRKIFKFLNGLGCYVTQADGMHVHHDAPELINDPALTYKLVKAFVENRKSICTLVDPVRHQRAPWDPTSLTMLEGWSKGLTEMEVPNRYYRPNSRYADEQQRTRRVSISNRWGRNDLNISALNEHGTVEWRLHEGSLKINEALAWIMFAQKFMHKVLNGKGLKPVANREELLSRIRLAKKEREAIERKLAERDYPRRYASTRRY